MNSTHRIGLVLALVCLTVGLVAIVFDTPAASALPLLLGVIGLALWVAPRRSASQDRGPRVLTADGQRRYLGLFGLACLTLGVGAVSWSLFDQGAFDRIVLLVFGALALTVATMSGFHWVRARSIGGG